MITRLNSATFAGIDAIPVNVEIFITSGIPGIMIVGLPDTSTKEAKDRVVAAIKNSKFDYPVKKITINLSPADIKKVGTNFDLPLAIGILISAGLIKCKINLDEYIIAGELSLNGKLNRVNGIIALSILAKKLNKSIIVPAENRRTAGLLGINFKAFNSLSEVCRFIEGKEIDIDINRETEEKGALNKIGGINEINHNPVEENNSYPDFSDIKGHEFAKRALEVAVSGHHNILFIGPPGSGKTMLAQSACGILPDISLEESIETSNIYGFSRKRQKADKDEGLIAKRPFISVHHTITTTGLIGGGGANPVPGDISLAHNGVLFIDEFSELSKKTLDSLRQPLEDKVVNLSRSRFSVIIPCNFMLIAAMNPCPCGYYGDEAHECRCANAEIFKFYNKLSGPIIDRFDIFVEVYSVNLDKLMNDADAEWSGSEDVHDLDLTKGCRSSKSSKAKERISRSRIFQQSRYKNTGIKFNSMLNGESIKKYINISNAALSFYNDACRKLNISSRAYYRTLKIARTIADLDEKEILEEDSILEALNYRKTKLMR